MDKDAKTLLKEEAERTGSPQPEYERSVVDGPDHKPLFESRVRLADGTEAIGAGQSKREADKNAAERALAKKGKA